ncbi:MAG: WecB/TagA/CpsF family glycosyltransferase [Pyramidobacter sp.]|nr:WecB/TagA/CpsF family glycosyltransferase [Pyramidobacter sp.]
MEFQFSAGALGALLAIAAGCVLLQRFFRSKLSRDQYFYMRDLSLMSVMMLLALWSGSDRIEALVACSLLAMVIGLAEQARPSRGFYSFIVLPGLIFALTGQPISFVSSAGSTFLYLTQWQSVVLTTAWMTLFPVLFRRLDQIPGLAGHLLGVSLSLMSAVTYFSRQNLNEAFLVSLVSLVLVCAYWSRLGHQFRQLGAPLASLWGTLVAGISIIGVSKGITLTALMVIPLGFYAVPLAEMSLGLVSHAFTHAPAHPVDLYSRVIERGVDHPAAVRLVTEICFLVGGSVSLMQLMPDSAALKMVVPVMAGLLLLVLWGVHGGRRPRANGHSLWGVKIDGISMNYALSKTLAWLRSDERKFRMVVTLNALGLNETRSDADFRRLANEADLTLPDGSGLVWAMRKLKMPVVERIAGVDYMDRLCRLAASEGIPIYLLGGRPGISRRAAEKLMKLHPGLIVTGCYDGYFDRAYSTKIAEHIRESGARILFAALGMPAQEKWLDSQRQALDGVLCVGVGGSFDVYAGVLKRAPKFWQKIGCEWLYRLFQEPWRIKRDLQLFSFVIMVLRERFNIFPWKDPEEKR